MSDFNLDALLDGTLDDLADAPTFAPYPIGTHKVNFTMEIKDFDKTEKDGSKGKVKKVVFDLVGIETVELPSGSDAAPIKAGDKTNMIFDLSNDYGQGDLKKVLAALSAKFGNKTNRELIEDAKSPLEALIITGQRSNRDDKSIKYTTLVEIALT